jgi:hypothetical protein
VKLTVVNTGEAAYLGAIRAIQCATGGGPRQLLEAMGFEGEQATKTLVYLVSLYRTFLAGSKTNSLPM